VLRSRVEGQRASRYRAHTERWSLCHPAPSTLLDSCPVESSTLGLSPSSYLPRARDTSLASTWPQHAAPVHTGMRHGPSMCPFTQARGPSMELRSHKHVAPPCSARTHRHVALAYSPSTRIETNHIIPTLQLVQDCRGVRRTTKSRLQLWRVRPTVPLLPPPPPHPTDQHKVASRA